MDGPSPLDIDTIERRAQLAPDDQLISFARSDIKALIKELRNLREQMEIYDRGLRSVCKAHLEATREIHRLNGLLEGKAV